MDRVRREKGRRCCKSAREEVRKGTESDGTEGSCAACWMATRCARQAGGPAASQVVFEVMVDLDSRRVLCFSHSVAQENPLCISGFLIPDSSYNIL